MRKDMLPKDWLYVIPNTINEFILYAPLHKKAVRITPQAAQELSPILIGDISPNVLRSATWAFLEAHGLLVIPEIKQAKKTSNKIFLSITNKCNLRCIYCYANTGTDNLSMPFEIAKNAIDNQIKHIIQSNEDTIAITFHGGGEAFVEMGLIKGIVEYIQNRSKDYGLKPVLGCVTNATLITKEVAKWLAGNFSHLTVSLDGAEEIQNLQRPRADGSGSYNKAISGINNLVRAKVDFAIRATVTELSVRKMSDFVQFVNDKIFPNGGELAFEPMSLGGRAQYTNSLATSPEVFLENYIVARQIGQQIGIEVSSSLDTFGPIKLKYCGASQASMQCYTPDGMISACTRVIKKMDAGSALFFYGNVNDNQIRLFSDAKDKITSFGNQYDDRCYSCFARWNCQGGCPNLRYTDKDHFEQACFVTRELLLYDLKYILDVYSANSPSEINE